MANFKDLLAELTIKLTDSPPRLPVKRNNPLVPESRNTSNSNTQIINNKAEYLPPPPPAVSVSIDSDLPLPPPPPEAFESETYMDSKQEFCDNSNTKYSQVELDSMQEIILDDTIDCIEKAKRILDFLLSNPNGVFQKEGSFKQNNSRTSDSDYTNEVNNIFDQLLPKLKGKSGIYDDSIYGICAKCGEQVNKGDEACIALDKLYHSRCFTCVCCSINLENVEFYDLNGEPYCKTDYNEKLDKCTICHEAIESKILRASKKPYHSKCFCCVECGKNLAGKSFMSNDSSQIHCVDDFYKKYAPECWYCKEKIVPKPGEDEICRIVALDRSFHEMCFKCEDCGELLSTGKAFYPIEGYIYCKECSSKRIARLSKTTSV